jgi:hexokinase
MATQAFPAYIDNVLGGITKMFDVSTERVQEITKHFVDDMRLGLAESSRPMAMM